MFYPDLKQKIDAGEIIVGDLVWVTGYYHSNFAERPTRHVPPTLVQIVVNEENPFYKSWAWVDYTFRACGNSGKLLKTVIMPFDKSRQDVRSAGSLDIFFTEEEANTAYIEAAKIVRDGIAQTQLDWAKRFTAMLSEVDERIAKNL